MESSNKQTKGRQRIDTSRRRESEEDRLITFSKRRSGLYKKASELCALCNTELVVLMFSPSGKPFSFAHPNIDVIARRFLKLPQEEDITGGIINARLRNRINELNERLTQLGDEAQAEKERGQMLSHMAKLRPNKPLCDENIDELSDNDAGMLKAWLLELQDRIHNRFQELAADATTYAGAPASLVDDTNGASSRQGSGGMHF
ncbi:hypothetical protein ACSBR2_015307 [Camellia fascicularis]